MGDAPMASASRVTATVLGFPRIGRDRELKFALEAHWRGEIDRATLDERAAATRAQSLQPAAAAGLDSLPSGDQCLYDHVLDMVLTLGLLPPRLADEDPADPALEFVLARGDAGNAPLEMTKWFDTNYHYLVPEIGPTVSPRLNADRQLARLAQALATGAPARPVLVGPYPLLRLAKPAAAGVDPRAHVDALIPLYLDLIAQLSAAGAAGVQIDEPALVLQPGDEERAVAQRALRALAESPAPITVATYFGGVERELDWLAALPIARLHLDLVRAPEQLPAAIEKVAAGACQGLSLGLVDGRNIWRTDLDAARALAATAVDALGAGNVTIASSCSLLHSPYDAARETELDPRLRGWLAFADEKVAELRLLADALNDPAAADGLLAANRAAIGDRRASDLVHDHAVQERTRAALAAPTAGRTPFDRRYPAQVDALGLPDLPTTTIGSFPQTNDLREARRRHRDGELDDAGYHDILAATVRDDISRQETIGIDVLVHGEPERNDMVEYFGEQLSGIAFTRNGWVQSYGSRGVKPPLIYGDVARPAPMTVDWWRLAQDATERPVKGMLTGPVTILQWSFVRDDIPRSEVAAQIALAIRDEVLDLEAAGCQVIQVDEPGLREGLPLEPDRREHYLRWAVDAFRLATGAVDDATQVHTHMCYADFDEIVDAIGELDADVISIEASRSDMGPLDAFAERYPNAVGPGVYDIHSPRVPTADEMERLLTLAEERIDRGRLWANPDCGLKTRTWEEVTPALINLVEAARRRRAAVSAGVAG